MLPGVSLLLFYEAKAFFKNIPEGENLSLQFKFPRRMKHGYTNPNQ